VNAHSVQRFNEGFSRYQSGVAAAELLPIFQEIAKDEPEEQSVWVCLSWLYLLNGEAEEAVKAARKSVFLDRDSAQAHINLALALTDSKQQGITYHVQQAQQLLTTYPDQKEAVLENFTEGQKRRPDWTTLIKLQQKILG
jgi:predicted Zn-dependent protease